MVPLDDLIRAGVVAAFVIGLSVSAFVAGQVIDTMTVPELRAVEPAGQSVRVAGRLHNVTTDADGYHQYRLGTDPGVKGVCHGELVASGEVVVTAKYKTYQGRPELFGACSDIYPG